MNTTTDHVRPHQTSTDPIPATTPKPHLGRIAAPDRASAPVSAELSDRAVTTVRATMPVHTTFDAIGTTIRVHVTEPTTLDHAAAITRDQLSQLDAAISRFRADSEVSALALRAQTGPAWAYVSATFAHYLQQAMRAARLTGGLVDPTVGSALIRAGYDTDLDVVRARGPRPTVSPGLPAHPADVPGWRTIGFDPTSRRVTTAQGTVIDLGSSAKAAAADRIAALLAAALPGGFLVNLGGDLATSGPVPPGGWAIGVEAADGHLLQVVAGTGQAFATSSTQKRTWTSTDASAPAWHHIIDPRTGCSAQTRWAQVTCAAVSALDANAASTAAIILDGGAPAWLAQHGIPARLDALDGDVVTTPGWPLETIQ